MPTLLHHFVFGAAHRGPEVLSEHNLVLPDLRGAVGFSPRPSVRKDHGPKTFQSWAEPDPLITPRWWERSRGQSNGCRANRGCQREERVPRERNRGFVPLGLRCKMPQRPGITAWTETNPPVA